MLGWVGGAGGQGMGGAKEQGMGGAGGQGMGGAKEQGMGGAGGQGMGEAGIKLISTLCRSHSQDRILLWSGYWTNSMKFSGISSCWMYSC